MPGEIVGKRLPPGIEARMDENAQNVSQVDFVQFLDGGARQRQGAESLGPENPAIGFRPAQNQRCSLISPRFFQPPVQAAGDDGGIPGLPLRTATGLRRQPNQRMGMTAPDGVGTTAGDSAQWNVFPSGGMRVAGTNPGGRLGRRGKFSGLPL